MTSTNNTKRRWYQDVDWVEVGWLSVGAMPVLCLMALCLAVTAGLIGVIIYFLMWLYGW